MGEVNRCDYYRNNGERASEIHKLLSSIGREVISLLGYEWTEFSRLLDEFIIRIFWMPHEELKELDTTLKYESQEFSYKFASLLSNFGTGTHPFMQEELKAANLNSILYRAKLGILKQRLGKV